MTRHEDTRHTRSQTGHPAWALLLQGVLAVAGGWPTLTHAASEGQPSAATPAPARRAPRVRRGASIDDRVAFLTKALDLDARQQSELRKVLTEQREAMLRAWADESVPAEARVKATEIISERTADRIRGLLSAEQRSRFTPPRAQREPEPGSPTPKVDDWMSPASGEGRSL